VEELTMGSRLNDHPIGVTPCDAQEGVWHITFGAGVEIGEITAALAQLPASATIMDASMDYFCAGDEDCDGQPVPDEDHDYFIVTFSVVIDDEDDE
jgi:hypothetical protein